MDYEKITEAAALFLKLNKAGMTKIRLLKLLYIADRDFLVRHGIPIFYDRYFSLPKGPVLSLTYDLMKPEKKIPKEASIWSKHIEGPIGSDQLMILKNDDLKSDNLSAFAIEQIEETFKKYENVGIEELIEKLHGSDCPEWSDPEGSSKEITVSEILNKWTTDIDRETTQKMEEEVNSMRRVIELENESAMIGLMSA